MAKTISGLDNLGRCVDLVELDPLDIVNSCKAIQAILPKGGSDSYDRGDYSIPKGVEMMSPYKLHVAGGETTMSNSYDFTRSFENSIKVDGGYAGFGFESSSSFKGVEKISESRNEVFTYVFANSAIHVVALDLDGVQAPYLILNANFKNRVKNLPDREDPAYSQFIKDYGTHFLSKVPLGGMCWSRVGSRKKTQFNSKEDEQTFTNEAKIELGKFTSGVSRKDSRKEVEESDKKSGISRTELNFVGGLGDVAEVSSKWVASLDGRSVPIYEGLELTRLSSLLTQNRFGDDPAIATKRALLDKATTLYIRQRGGEEGRRIRYGDPVQLLTATERWRLYYHTTGQGFLPLYPPDPARAPIAGASAATFVLHGVGGRANGNEVLAGDPVGLEVKGAGVYMRIELAIAQQGPQKGQQIAVLRYLPTPAGPEGDWSLRIRGTGQRYEGPDMESKRRPLVSGDIVMISRFDKTLRQFETLSTSGASGVIPARSDADNLFRAPDKADECQFFVIKNA